MINESYLPRHGRSGPRALAVHGTHLPEDYVHSKPRQYMGLRMTHSGVYISCGGYDPIVPNNEAQSLPCC